MATTRNGVTKSDTSTLVRAGVVLGASAIVGWLARRVSGHGATPADAVVRRETRSHTSGVTRVTALAVSVFGYPVVYVPAALLLGRWLHGRRARGSRPLAAAALGGWATQRAIKLLVTRRRPPSQAGDSNEQRSFPSGHTTGVTAVAVTAAYVLYQQQLITGPVAGGLAAAPPLLMGLSRVYADEHWATDVLAGMATGSAIAGIAAEAFERTNEWPNGRQTGIPHPASLE